MFKKKNKQIKTSPNKSNLDQVLWFIENYLPQKKDRGVQKKLYRDNLEAETIKIFSKLASTRSKRLLPTTKNTTITFTFGNWSLPYLKLLKKIGIAK
jgi:CRISPR/Cas system CMR-associated protein Cmr5 small subunit